LPEQYRLTLSHGRPVAQDNRFRGVQIQRGIPRRGPLWFRKMDRNGDGDVSPAEWLGTMEQFRALGLGGDGPIDAHDAENAERELGQTKRGAPGTKKEKGGGDPPACPRPRPPGQSIAPPRPGLERP